MPTPVITPRILPQLPTAPKTPPGTQPRSFPFPNGNVPGNKSPTDLDDCEEICVWIKTPTKTLKKIIYQYPGELPVEVEGENFSTNVTQSYVLDNTRWYFIDWNARSNRDFVFIESTTGAWGQFDFYWRNIPNVGRQPRIVSRLGDNFIDYGQGTLQEITNPIFNLIGELSYLRFGTFQITRVRDANTNQTVPPQSLCTFRVFNSIGIPFINITRNVCPTAFILPESCIYPEGYDLAWKARKVITDTRGNPLSVETRNNCIDIKFKLIGIPPINITVKTVCSPVGCPPPQYKIDCCKEYDCTNKKCPKGTTNRILIGGKTLQCVDANGCVLSEIPYDPKCEKVDCRC